MDIIKLALHKSEFIYRKQKRLRDEIPLKINTKRHFMLEKSDTERDKMKKYLFINTNNYIWRQLSFMEAIELIIKYQALKYMR